MSTASDIKRLLDEALGHDQAAAAKRRRAGRELARLRAEYPDHWRNMSGVDDVTAEMLLRMAGV